MRRSSRSSSIADAHAEILQRFTCSDSGGGGAAARRERSYGAAESPAALRESRLAFMLIACRDGRHAPQGCPDRPRRQSDTRRPAHESLHSIGRASMLVAGLAIAASVGAQTRRHRDAAEARAPARRPSRQRSPPHPTSSWCSSRRRWTCSRRRARSSPRPRRCRSPQSSVTNIRASSARRSSTRRATT